MEKLPPNAKMVFKGEIFEVWQWQQKVYDGSTSTFEALSRPDTVQVIATSGDKILLQTQSQPHKPIPFLSLPGGRCEKNEKPLDAAKREMLEETGYESDDWQLLNVVSPQGKIVWKIYTYVARNCQKTSEQKLDIGEKIENKLIAFDAFLDLADDDKFRNPDFKLVLMKAKCNQKAKEELKRKIFG
jgi:ADP-ribose pyrophosphatase